MRYSCAALLSNRTNVHFGKTCGGKGHGKVQGCDYYCCWTTCPQCHGTGEVCWHNSVSKHANVVDRRQGELLFPISERSKPLALDKQQERATHCTEVRDWSDVQRRMGKDHLRDATFAVVIQRYTDVPHGYKVSLLLFVAHTWKYSWHQCYACLRHLSTILINLVQFKIGDHVRNSKIGDGLIWTILMTNLLRARVQPWQPQTNSLKSHPADVHPNLI